MFISIFIDRYLSYTFEQFKEDLTQANALCLLRDFTYRNGVVPDYNLRLMRNYYLLRYFYAYFSEYYWIYSLIFTQRRLSCPYSVLSIGCGAGIDFLSLRALRDNNIQYLGVDIVDWGRIHPPAQFVRRNIADISPCVQNKNIIFFPKSLSEFSDSDFSRFVQCITPNLLGSSFCVASSLMSEGCCYDIDRIKVLQNRIHELGFQTTQEITHETHPPQEDSCFSIISTSYPNEIKVFLMNLNSSCRQTCQQECEINKSPILKTDYMRYHIIFFEKSEKKQ